MAAARHPARTGPQPMFGREPELAQLDALIGGLDKQGAALLVRGQAGIGKSALLAEAARRADAAGVRVLRATGVQSESSLPFAGLHQLLLTLLDGVDALPERQRVALQAAFGMAETAQPPDRFLLGLAVLELLSDAAEESPILVLADDAQWIDPSTIDVLTFIARRLEPEPIGLVLAVRTGAGNSLSGSGLPKMVIGGLDPDASQSLLRAQGRELAPEVQARLLQQAAGNPLALIELPVSLSGSELSGGSPLPSYLPLTARLEQNFVAQIRQLPPPTQMLLEVAASDDSQPLLSEVLAATNGLTSDPPTADRLDAAVEAGLVRIDEGKVAFVHPLVRSALVQAMAPAERRAVHASWAEALTDDLDRRVWHCAAALVEKDDEVADELDQSAARARRRGATGTAIMFLERAAGLSTSERQQGRRLVDAAMLAFESGARRHGRTLLGEAQRLDLAAAERSRVFLAHYWYVEGGRSLDTHPGTLVDAAQRVWRDGEQEVAADLLELAADLCFVRSAGLELRRRVAETVTTFGMDQDPRFLVVSAMARPIDRGAEVIKTLTGIPVGMGIDPLVAQGLGAAANVLGERDLAVRFLTKSVDTLRGEGRVGELMYSLRVRGEVHWSEDRWDAAASDGDESRRLAEELDQSMAMASARIVEAKVAAVHGERSRTRSLVKAIERVAVPAGASNQLAHVRWTRGILGLTTGRPEEAYEHLSAVFRPRDPAWHYSIRLFMIGDLAEAARAVGRVDDVRALLPDIAAAVERMDSPAGRRAVEFAEAMLAGDDEAEARFDAALRGLRTRRPFARARLQLALGAWLRRERRVVESRVPLRGATEAFDALGATLWAERAREELRASGVESRPRTRGVTENLTPQERQIVRLAAGGLSNREIGEQLFLSHRTVGAHLYRAFPKLGVSSRAQLRLIVDADPVENAAPVSVIP